MVNYDSIEIRQTHFEDLESTSSRRLMDFWLVTALSGVVAQTGAAL
jgi:hypothetical protein